MVRIGFSTARRNPVSWLIRTITGSRTSHAWLLLEVQPFNQDMVLEASEWGVRLVPYRVFKRSNRIVTVFAPAVLLDPGMLKAGDLLGAYYDFAGLVGMAVVMLGRWLRRKWRNPLNAAKGMFCSELVVKVLQWSHYPGAHRQRADRTSPQDLLEFLEAEQVAGRIQRWGP